MLTNGHARGTGYHADLGRTGYHADLGRTGYHADLGRTGYHADLGRTGYHADLGRTGYHADLGRTGYHADLGGTGYHADLSIARPDNQANVHVPQLILHQLQCTWTLGAHWPVVKMLQHHTIVITYMYMYLLAIA